MTAPPVQSAADKCSAGGFCARIRWGKGRCIKCGKAPS